MATNITQLEDDERNMIVLRVEGEMFKQDADLLRKISEDLRSTTERKISLDLSDLDLLDSDAAAVIREMEQTDDFQVEGIPFFVQKVVSETESKTG